MNEYLITVLTSMSGHGNYYVSSVLMDPSIRLCSVYKKILPPAPWDTTTGLFANTSSLLLRRED
jgi:hypothetical protein